MVVEQVNDAGRVIARFEPTAPGRTQADEGKSQDDELAARRDRALLATYGTEAEIEEARQRALRVTAAADAVAINARYDAELKRYRELMRLRQEAPPLRMEKGVRIVKPAPAQRLREKQDARDVDKQRLRDQQHARDLVEREARMLRELREQRKESPPQVLRIDEPPRMELSPPREKDWPESMERDRDDIRFPSRQPSTPQRH